jgi:RNA polymerase sigma-70 factor (ECF subfamily)
MTNQTMSLHSDIDPAATRRMAPTPATIDAVVRDYYPHVQRFAHSILNDPDEAEDAAQEAMIAAVNSLEKFRGESSFKTWLYGITLNICRGHLRKKRTRQTVANALTAFQLVMGHQPTPEESAARNESERELWSAVDSLDEGHRMVVILRYVHELPVREIAEIMRLNEGTVHSRLHYARRTLARKLTLKNQHTHFEEGEAEL